jgi:CARDB
VGSAQRGRRAPLRAVMAAAAAVAAAVALATAPTAGAYDTGPHFDITRDALTAEGFNDTAIQTVQVSNWFVDLYENAKTIPFSGHAGAFKELIGGVNTGVEAVAVALNRWPDAVVENADRSHFDASGGGFSNAAQITAEWDRLRRAVGALAVKARVDNDPAQLLSVLGISLHQVQDFYSHTNWLEPGGVAGGQGPDWAGKGFGRTPTWFDVPAPMRSAEVLYAGGSVGIGRNHGGWNADGNTSLTRFNAKDWPGRPLYTEAYLASYFATRQWVQALRAHVADEAFWARAMRLARAPALLAKDQKGALNISFASGHWQGQGEACNPSFSTLSCGDRNGPGGNLIDLRGAVIDYFKPVLLVSEMRRRFESNITLTHGDAPGTPFAVPSSQPMQASTRFARLQVTSMAEIDNLDIPGDADLFTRARIGSQRFISGVINSRDSFSFRLPNYPFTFIKSVPTNARFTTPVTSLRVRVRTGDVRFAGTDDDVYLRINDRQRFPLDKRLYDDFERDDDDTYSVPIDGALEDGLSVSDIRFLQIEKSPDRLAGGWRLGGAQIWVNDRLAASDNRINRWLEDNHRTWRAPRPSLPTASGTAAPAFLQLWEQDAPIRGDHDHTDTHPWDGRRDTALAYAPGSGDRTGQAVAGSLYGGRLGDGSKARLSWKLSTLEAGRATITPSPNTGGPPDLRITAFDRNGFTVTNSGTGPAGPFLVSAEYRGSVGFPGLAPGASIAHPLPQACSGGATYTATADAANQVAESNEANNALTFGPVFC